MLNIYTLLILEFNIFVQFTLLPVCYLIVKCLCKPKISLFIICDPGPQNQS